MTKIKYIYIFDEEIDRVYDCFTNIQLNSGISYLNFIYDLKFIKGERFDEENSIYSCKWKNYYNVKMIAENIKAEPNFRTYTNKSLYIDKIPIQLSLIYNFYYDTIEQKTLFILYLEYDDDFFGELIKSEISQLDIIKICENIKKYLFSITLGLNFVNSFQINFPIEELWKTISNLEIFFSFVGKKITPIFKDKEVNLDSIIYFYDSSDKETNKSLSHQLIVNSLFITENYIKLSLITLNKLKYVNQKITFIIKRLETKKCMFIAKVRILEPCEHKLFLTIKKIWDNLMTNYYHSFELKKKKKKSKY